MENQLKDEQIRNQAETIQSLERKIESLEKELQKFLDPDTGEINPSLKAPHGEKVLLQHVQSLEKQLADCLEPQGPGELTRDKGRLLEERIYITITSAFLPTYSWSKSNNTTSPNFHAWWCFRSLLFELDLFESHWSRREFRYGADSLNDICQATEDRPTKMKQFNKFELGYRLFGGGNDWHHEQKCKAIQSLISSLVLIRENQELEDINRILSRDEINEMLASLKIVALCQKLWTEAKPEEKEVVETEE